MRIAGRRERAIVAVVLVMEEREEGRIEEAVLVADEGPRRERSSMKFPTARLEGVRGRWRVRVMS